MTGQSFANHGISRVTVSTAQGRHDRGRLNVPKAISDNLLPIVKCRTDHDKRQPARCWDREQRRHRGAHAPGTHIAEHPDHKRPRTTPTNSAKSRHGQPAKATGRSVLLQHSPIATSSDKGHVATSRRRGKSGFVDKPLARFPFSKEASAETKTRLLPCPAAVASEPAPAKIGRGAWYVCASVRMN